MTIPGLDGLVFIEMDVTRPCTSSALLWYRSPEQTFTFPPSTAHNPESIDEIATAPARDDHHIYKILAS